VNRRTTSDERDLADRENVLGRLARRPEGVRSADVREYERAVTVQQRDPRDLLGGTT
jgi:hypothetical protein